jgi:D-alanyl-D-alanine dipeptidase
MVLAYASVLAALSAAVPAGLPDKGLFSALDSQVTIIAPAWVPRERVTLAADRVHRVLTLILQGEPVKAYPMAPTCGEDKLECLGLRDQDSDELGKILKSASSAAATFVPPNFSDTDGDGIADSVDILLGAKKTVLLRSAYQETSPKLAYPGGDVPDNVGVCTDVIVRALRNAGIDLQKAIFEDARLAPQAYQGIRERNPSLDHRRVRNLAVYFKRHWRPIQRRDDLLPGDVVLLDTFPSKPGPDHIGIVSDVLGPSRLPLIINAWTNGFHTEEMDLLPSIPMTIAYRSPMTRAATAIMQPQEGSPQLLVLPPSVRQLVFVVTEDWNQSSAQLSLWERDEGHGWKRRASPTRATVGAAGLGWGRGLHADTVAAALGGPQKREGDGRAPAGIFRLSSATGYARLPPVGTRLPYRQATDELRCVDDPASPYYNQLRRLSVGARPSWRSDEEMKRSDVQYQLTVVVDHNRAPVRAGAGSCIFLHTWPAAGTASPGCTMMALTDVEKIVTWLDPRAHPVLVQLPMSIAAKAARGWGLPAPIP